LRNNITIYKSFGRNQL